MMMGVLLEGAFHIDECGIAFLEVLAWMREIVRDKELVDVATCIWSIRNLRLALITAVPLVECRAGYPSIVEYNLRLENYIRQAACDAAGPDGEIGRLLDSFITILTMSK